MKFDVSDVTRVIRDPEDTYDNSPYPYSPDCIACFKGRAHTNLEHEQILDRNYRASLPNESSLDNH